MNKYVIFIVAVALLFAAGYTSCKDKTIEVSGITLSAGSSVTMKEGDQIPLTVVIEPANATHQDVTWSSSDETVAKVVSRVLHAYKAGSATITAKAGNRTATCNVTVEAATPAYTYVISASTLASFGSAEEGYTQPVARNVAITNTGTGAVTLNALPAVANYTLTALSATELAAGATATFTIRPNAGLAAGTYNPTFNVTGTGGASVSISPTFTVTAALTYSISASPVNLPFGALMPGYAQPDARTVTIANDGTGAVALDALPTVPNYTLGTLSATTLAAGATATFTVRPNAGLGVGTYNPTFNVTGTPTVSVTISPTFLVSATTTYSINVSPNNPSFGSLQTPYEQPDALTVTITNDGTGSVTLDVLPTVPNYTLGTLSATTLAAGATATFTVRPNAGLGVGAYNPTITITGSNGASATLAPTFTVTAPVIPENPGSGLPEDLPVGDL